MLIGPKADIMIVMGNFLDMLSSLPLRAVLAYPVRLQKPNLKIQFVKPSELATFLRRREYISPHLVLTGMKLIINLNTPGG